MSEPMTKDQFLQLNDLYSALLRGDHQPDFMICDWPTYMFVNHAMSCPVLKRTGRYIKCAHGWKNYHGIRALKLNPKRLPQ